MAIQILSLTTSSSIYERNWSAFDGITAISDDEEIEEDGSFRVGEEAIGVGRELHEDDFMLDEEQVEGGENFEFNSDEEGFI
nr:hypothetical protein [Tanacetum cinerariifolium]